MNILRRLRAAFAWRVVRRSAVWTYLENSVTGRRKAYKHSSRWQPLDFSFLRGGDSIVDEYGVRVLEGVPAAPRVPTGGSRL